jgi:hypothetical protein
VLQERFKLRDITTLTRDNEIDYLGMRLQINQAGNITIDNRRQCLKMLERWGLQDCNATRRPLLADTLSIMRDEKQAGDFLDDEDTRSYQAGVGELNWLAQTTHPDLSVAVSLLGTFNSKPPASGLNAVKKCMRYVAGVADNYLETNIVPGQEHQVYSDSDHAGMHKILGDTRSRGGLVETYYGMVFNWKSFWESERLSSAEAELVAASEAVKSGLHHSFVLQEMFQLPQAPVPVWMDSSAAIGFANDTACKSKMKYLDQRLNWVQLVKDRSQTKLLKIIGTENPADYLTKLFGAHEFQSKREFYVRNASS